MNMKSGWLGALALLVLALGLPADAASVVRVFGPGA